MVHHVFSVLGCISFYQTRQQTARRVYVFRTYIYGRFFPERVRGKCG